jgi:multicomponent Na+:H+ antiporter subunit B
VSWQFDLLIFVLLIVTAVAAVWVRSMVTAVAVLSAYSLFAALLFAGAGALDVAFVEAVLGSAFVGILFVVVIAATGDEPTRRSRAGQLVAVPAVGAFVVLMLIASVDLPDRGDPEAPAFDGAAADYVEGSLDQTDTPNVVTAILADYRSVDTLGETLVVFTAAVAVVVVLRREVTS